MSPNNMRFDASVIRIYSKYNLEVSSIRCVNPVEEKKLLQKYKKLFFKKHLLSTTWKDVKLPSLVGSLSHGRLYALKNLVDHGSRDRLPLYLRILGPTRCVLSEARAYSGIYMADLCPTDDFYVEGKRFASTLMELRLRKESMYINLGLTTTGMHDYLKKYAIYDELKTEMEDMSEPSFLQRIYASSMCVELLEELAEVFPLTGKLLLQYRSLVSGMYMGALMAADADTVAVNSRKAYCDFIYTTEMLENRESDFYPKEKHRLGNIFSQQCGVLNRTYPCSYGNESIHPVLTDLLNSIYYEICVRKEYYNFRKLRDLFES